MRTNRTQLTPQLVAIIHPTHNNIHHLLSNIWKENRGAALPCLVAVFFIVLSGDYNMPWRIYIFTSSGASSVQTFLYHPIVAFYLSLLFLFFLGWFESSVNI
jgi:hypothetical protein